MAKFESLVSDIRACTLCADHLPLGPRPVIQVSQQAKILVVGQAPGTAVHRTGLPFNDPSGDRLRRWMGVDRDVFYDDRKVATVPMGFCYPGKGPGGDLPPRKECAATWRKQLLDLMPQVELTIAVGRYAINWHLKPPSKMTLADALSTWRDHYPDLVPLPHPSPRNTYWLRNHPWVEAEIVPALQARVSELVGPASV